MAILQMIKLTVSVSFMQAATPRAGRVFYQLAAEHGGYFTTAEASPAGISHRQLSYHAASGASMPLLQMATAPSRFNLAFRQGRQIGRKPGVERFAEQQATQDRALHRLGARPRFRLRNARKSCVPLFPTIPTIW